MMASQSASVSAIGFCSSTCLAGLRRGQHMLGVLVGRAGDEDGVDVVALEQGVQIALEMQAIFGALRLAALRIGIPAGDHPRIVEICMASM